jgi:hypothetical protein
MQQIVCSDGGVLQLQAARRYFRPLLTLRAENQVDPYTVTSASGTSDSNPHSHEEFVANAARLGQ